MSARTRIPSWILAVTAGFALVVAVRYAMAINAGVTHGVALRTYVFWALVCLPVAYLSDTVGRTVLNYRPVRVVVARVRTRR